MLRCAVIPALVMLCGGAEAATYVVSPDGSGDFPTIQEALVAVLDGDTIELADGTFRGAGNRDIDFLGKAVLLRSQSGDAESCVLDCQGSPAEPHRAFDIDRGEGPTTVIQGLTIEHGYAAGSS